MDEYRSTMTVPPSASLFVGMTPERTQIAS